MHDWFAELLKPIYVVPGHGNAKNCTKSPPIPSLLSLIKFNKVQSIVCATFPGYEWLWHVLNASPGWENGTKPGVPCHSSFLPRTRHKGLQGSFFRSTRPPLVTSNNSRAFNFYVLRHPAPLHPFHRNHTATFRLFALIHTFDSRDSSQPPVWQCAMPPILPPTCTWSDECGCGTRVVGCWIKHLIRWVVMI